VVPPSYLDRTGQLAAFLYRRRPALVDIAGKIDEVDAALISPRSALRNSMPLAPRTSVVLAIGS
jgi:hypothetical protein